MLDLIMHATNEQVFGGLAILTGLVLAVSYVAAKRNLSLYGDVLGAAQLLTVVLGLSVICRISAPPGGVGNMAWLCLIDLAALMVSAYWFIVRPTVWSFILSFCFIAQLVAHAGFWRAQSAGIDTRIAYILCLNVTHVLQLVAVGWPGSKHVAGVFVALLHDRRGRGVPFGYGAPQ
ncbi:phosphatidylserine synthase [Caulobacter sp. BE264]|uniref:hypothetical protein n=1 Tax=Caulobacter sp. BE264 TaxID=2817724 RepID=UPI0028567716|nr:hypothetical protein [Caulobacter sp. BE264]MDR7232069.1 phosphatidylserine synthase [Caulobacter sp. BE264]